MADNLTPRNLLYTERGKKWLDQFLPEDREIAEKIVSSLTLVSHSEFERAIQGVLEKEVSRRDGPFAFYAVREINFHESYFDQCTNLVSGKIDALVSGSDHGSEARVASLIRNYCKTAPEDLLNHPSIEEMRSSKCRTVILVDDFIGSGERTRQFIQALWCDLTFVSWRSLKYIKVIVVAYSGTDKGIRAVEKHKANAEVIIERGCPSFKEMPWQKKRIKEVTEVCKKYGSKTSQGYWWDGYGQVMAAIAFEHGCPDNAPVILWAPHEQSKPWQPLFPNRVILAGEKSVFPPEIVRRDPVTTLLDVGQKRLANAGALSRRGEMGEMILIVLALIAQGQRKRIAISFATGLSEELCSRIVEKCIKWGFVTRSRRLTEKGNAELEVARKSKGKQSIIPDKGDECYYPKLLRRATRG